MLTAEEPQQSPVSGALNTGFGVFRKGLVMVRMVVLKFCTIVLRKKNVRKNHNVAQYAYPRGVPL